MKEMRKEFMDRCVSPTYHNINRLQLNGEVVITNMKKVIAAQEEEDAVYKNTRSKKGKKKGVKGMPMPPPGAYPQGPWGPGPMPGMDGGYGGGGYGGYGGDWM